jgi:hypothetical protein
MRSGETVDRTRRSLLGRNQAIRRRGYAIVCRLGAVTRPSLAVSLGATTIGSCARVISGSLTCLGALVPSVCSAVAGVGYAVVSFGSAVTILTDPVAVLGGLVGVGRIAIPGIARRIIVHAAHNTLWPVTCPEPCPETRDSSATDRN